MLIAYNNDIEFRNRWYHIQTEDNGLKDGHITTTVFYSGQILDSKSISYLDAIAGITDPDKQNQIIKDMMIKQHQMFYGKLNAGTYEDIVMGAAKRPATGVSSISRAIDKPGIPSSVSNAASAHAAEKPAIAPGTVNGGLPGPSHSDSPSSNASPRINKPDILRASSQQTPSVSKNLDLKSLSGKPSNSTASNRDAKPSASINYAPINYAPKINMPQAGSGVAQSSRQPSLKSPIPCSKAVERYRQMGYTRAWRGVYWEDMDLSIDALVAVLLEDGKA